MPRNVIFSVCCVLGDLELASLESQFGVKTTYEDLGEASKGNHPRSSASTSPCPGEKQTTPKCFLTSVYPVLKNEG